MYYFAYGSNMNWQQMQQRCPSSRFTCVARLPDYRFAIARHSRLRDCGTANVYPESGADVWGIVYDVSDPDLRVMDGYEDGYSRQKTRVYPRDTASAPLEAIVYIAPRELVVPLPNSDYKLLMLDGARYWNLPAEYCLALERIEAATS